MHVQNPWFSSSPHPRVVCTILWGPPTSCTVPVKTQVGGGGRSGRFVIHETRGNDGPYFRPLFMGGRYPSVPSSPCMYSSLQFTPLIQCYLAGSNSSSLSIHFSSSLSPLPTSWLTMLLFTISASASASAFVFAFESTSHHTITNCIRLVIAVRMFGCIVFQKQILLIFAIF